MKFIHLTTVIFLSPQTCKHRGLHSHGQTVRQTLTLLPVIDSCASKPRPFVRDFVQSPPPHTHTCTNTHTDSELSWGHFVPAVGPGCELEQVCVFCFSGRQDLILPFLHPVNGLLLVLPLWELHTHTHTHTKCVDVVILFRTVNSLYS